MKNKGVKALLIFVFTFLLIAICGFAFYYLTFFNWDAVMENKNLKSTNEIIYNK